MLWTAGPAEVRVVDGDALHLGGRILRLENLTVPRRGQARCPGAEGGDCAAAALVRLVGGKALECRVRGQDRHGRWALADGSILAPQEALARQQGLGLWASGAIRAESWRGRL